jgi:hypothetical protein
MGDIMAVDITTSKSLTGKFKGGQPILTTSRVSSKIIV